MNTLLSMAWAGLKSRKRSSLLLFTSILLSMLFLTVISIVCLSAIHSAELMRQDAQGEHKVAAWNVSDSQYETLKKTGLFSRIGLMTAVGAVQSSAYDTLYIGTADREAVALGHIRLTEGAMPETEREIALEKSAYKYLSGQKIAVGDTVTLELLPPSGESLQKQFTVSGILENYTAHWKDLLNFSPEDEPFMPPSFLLSRKGADALGLTENRILLLDSSLSPMALSRKLPAGLRYGFNLGESAALVNSGYILPQNYVIAGAMLGGAVLVSTTLILLNGFLMSVDRRRQQLALLRSIGATRRQARRYVLSEALILCAGAIPAGLLAGALLSLAVVRLFSSLLENALTYRFSWLIPVLAAALCLLSTLTAVLAPAYRASRQSPVAAARKPRGRGRKKRGNPYKQGALGPAGMMWISMKNSKGKALLTILSFSLVIVIFSAMLLLNAEALTGTRYRDPDVYLHPQEYASHFPPIARAELRKDIPQSIFEDLSRQSDVAFQAADPRVFFALRIPKEKNDDYTNAAFCLDYKRLGLNTRYSKELDKENTEKNKAFYEIEDFWLRMTMYDAVLLKKLQNQVSDGKIDIAAIEAGDEIVVSLPDFAFSIEVDKGGAIMSGNEFLSDAPVITPDKKIFRNTNWKAGDTLTFAWEEKLPTGDTKLHEKNVRIGAVVRDSMRLAVGSGVFEIITGVNTLTALDLPHEISTHSVFFDDRADTALAETEITQYLQRNYPLIRAVTRTEITESDRRTRNLMLAIMAMLLVCVFSLGFVGLMNTVSNRIYNRVHETGLLRSIGMTKGQVLRMFTYEGAVFGVCASLLGALGSVPLLGQIQENWLHTSTPRYMAAVCAGCILFSSFAVYLPARRILRGNPAETVRRNY